jgi:hypothetical protein
MEASPLTESVNHLHAWLALDDAEPALSESKRELRSRRRDWLKDVLPDSRQGLTIRFPSSPMESHGGRLGQCSCSGLVLEGLSRRERSTR